MTPEQIAGECRILCLKILLLAMGMWEKCLTKLNSVEYGSIIIFKADVFIGCIDSICIGIGVFPSGVLYVVFNKCDHIGYFRNNKIRLMCRNGCRKKGATVARRNVNNALEYEISKQTHYVLVHPHDNLNQNNNRNE